MSAVFRCRFPFLVEKRRDPELGERTEERGSGEYLNPTLRTHGKKQQMVKIAPVFCVG